MKKTIKKTSQHRLEKLIRSYRQRVFDNELYTDKIIRAKKHLAPIWREEHDARMTKKLERWLEIQ